MGPGAHIGSEGKVKSTETRQKRPGKTASGRPMESSRCVRLMDAEERFDLICTAAYFKAEARNFAGGRELDDWLEAETELDASMRSGMGQGA